MLDAVEQFCGAYRRALPSGRSLPDSGDDRAGSPAEQVEEVVVGGQYPHAAFGQYVRREVLQVAGEKDRRPPAETGCDVSAVARIGGEIISDVVDVGVGL